MAASVASRVARCTELPVAGDRGFEAAVDELMTMRGVYKNGSGTLPPRLGASATVDALGAICELDLSRNHSSDDPGDQEPSGRRGYYKRPRFAYFRLSSREC